MATRRALVGHATLDTFRHQLFYLFRRILEITVCGSLFLRHGAQRSHAAIRFIRTSLIQLDFTGRLFGAGEQSAEHHRIRAGRDGLGHVARITDAAVGDQRHTGFGQRFRHVGDRR